MKWVHLVEDDPILGRSLCILLESEGFGVNWHQSLTAAKAEAAKPDIYVLDLNLPDGCGLDFLKQLKAVSGRPVLILTAKTDEDTVVAALEAGASDYVRKPFGNRELIARINGLLKDSTEKSRLEFGGLELMMEKRSASFEGRNLTLKRKEFDILAHLIRHAESVVTRENLLDALGEAEIYDRTIDSHISHIRAAMKSVNASSVVISPVYGVGYRLERAR